MLIIPLQLHFAKDGYVNSMCDCDMSHIMRKPDFCICKNKGADQLHGFVSYLVGNPEDMFSHDTAQYEPRCQTSIAITVSKIGKTINNKSKK